MDIRPLCRKGSMAGKGFAKHSRCYTVDETTKSFILSTDLQTRQIPCVANSGAVEMYVYNNNSVALVREPTIPIERPPLVGEVSANFC
jgi:hypothetical protein